MQLPAAGRAVRIGSRVPLDAQARVIPHKGGVAETSERSFLTIPALAAVALRFAKTHRSWRSAG